MSLVGPPLADQLRETKLVGDLPKDWEVSVIGHSHPFVTSGSRGWARYYSDIGAPFIRIGNLSHDWIDVSLSDFQYVKLDSTALAESTRTCLHHGDLLISITADIGAIGFVHNQVPLPAYINQHIALVRFDPATVHSRFAAYVLSSQPVQRIFRSSMDVGAKAGMSLITVRKILLPLPPVPEQEAIAEALTDADGLIGALEKLIAKNRAIRQAAMQQLLTSKTRLPSFSDEWETKRIDELAEIKSGATPSTQVAAFWNGSISWCTPTDITSTHGKYLSVTERSVTEAGLAACAANLLPPGSLLLCTRATIGEIRIATTHICTNQGFKSLVCRPDVSNEFIYYMVLTLRTQMVERSIGSTFLEIGKRDLASIQIRIPPKDEQIAITTVLSNMDAEIEALERQRDKARQIKQGMMQQLLTGRIRLVKPDIKADEKTMTRTGARQANVHFIRSVLAAEIIDQLHEQPTFGHVKFEKMMFLVEHLCEVETGSTYHRKAAGPYDNRALRSIDSQLRAQQWFDARKEGKRYQYVPMQKRGGHKRYFDRYFSGIGETFHSILGVFKTLDTERCEIVATLLAAWSDLLRDKEPVSDELIVQEVLNNWHEAKRRISEDRWLKALGWMRSQGFVPKEAS